jgi:hypothetical protein
MCSKFLRRGQWLGWIALLALGVSAVCEAAETPGERPGIHAHNDYEHPRPLFDALAVRAASIEADVHLVDGRLLVAHDRDQVRVERTLEALYLDPLQERVRDGGGKVYSGEAGPVILLVDVKGEAVATYRVLERLLERYAGLLTHFDGDQIQPGAVTVIISGNRDRAALGRPGRRLAAMDGRLGDLGGSASAAVIPLVSDNWARHFTWRGEGAMPDEEKARLRQLAEQARTEGRLLRFWNTPDRPVVWRELKAAGVGLIGTDDLAGLRGFMDGAEP